MIEKPTHPAVPVARTRDGVWVSTIAGDRACNGCGFNLIGQPIVREEKYSLFITRCPECSMVAALQEYPSMGRWARRVGALAAAFWLLLILGGSFAMGGVLTGFTMLAVSMGAEPYTSEIQEAHRLHLESQGSGSTFNMGYYGDLTAKWLEQQDLAAMLESAGGFPTALRRAAGALPALVIPGLIFGCIIGVAMMHRRGWRLALAAAVPVVIAALFTSMAVVGDSVNTGSLWANDVARYDLGPRLAPLALLIAWLAMTIGALIGRPVARWFVRLMLPPRLVTPLSSLWLCDGKRPPRPDGKPPSSA